AIDRKTAAPRPETRYPANGRIRPAPFISFRLTIQTISKTVETEPLGLVDRGRRNDRSLRGNRLSLHRARLRRSSRRRPGRIPSPCARAHGGALRGGMRHRGHPARPARERPMETSLRLGRGLARSPPKALA